MLLKSQADQLYRKLWVTIPITDWGTWETSRLWILGMLFPVRIVTASWDITVTSADYTVGIFKNTPEVTNVNLPAGSWLRFEISDFAWNANLFPFTLVPNVWDTIMGQSSMLVNIAGWSVTLVYNKNNNDRRVI